jgi:hypothetical protein
MVGGNNWLTETWLDKSIPSTDYFPNNMYNIYRNDRAPNTKDKIHGGVLLAITKDYISSEITELKTNCEIVCPTHMFEEFVLSNLLNEILS